MRDLSLHLMDIIQNSISAGADKITVSVYADDNMDELIIMVEDDGTGMDGELLKHVADPFTTTRTTRRVGLGIPLLKASAQRADGDLEVLSVKGRGTTLKAKFKIAHIDRPPLGNVTETMIGVIMANPEITFELKLKTKKGEFKFNSLEVKERLGDIPITQYEVITWIREYIDEGVKAIFGGVLNEIVS